MGTEILKSFGTLQSELEQARSSLKGVDENIKRLIGRDPSEIPTRPPLKRGTQVEERSRQRVNRTRSFENGEPPTKRRPGGVSVFKRLSEKVHYEDEVQQPQKQMISKVIVTPKELPSRQEALAAQSKDEKSKARNRRMFGALLGTLQKFQQEETKLRQKEEKRAQLEKKIEEHEIKEKEEIKKERQELFFNRKKKQAEIKMIELKMMRMKEYATWEERQKPRMCFITTKAKPHIHYLPRKMNDASKALLETSKSEIEKLIDEKRQEVFDELQHIEDRMNKNFDLKKTKDVKEQSQSHRGEEDEDDEEDDDDEDKEIDDKIKEAKNNNNEDENEKVVDEETSTEVIEEVQKVTEEEVEEKPEEIVTEINISKNEETVIKECDEKMEVDNEEVL